MENGNRRNKKIKNKTVSTPCVSHRNTKQQQYEDNDDKLTYMAH